MKHGCNPDEACKNGIYISLRDIEHTTTPARLGVAFTVNVVSAGYERRRTFVVCLA